MSHKRFEIINTKYLNKQNIFKINRSTEIFKIKKKKKEGISNICKEFILKFINKENELIYIDKLINELQIEKRKIYDIINIFEGLKVVEKIKSNLYIWKNYSYIFTTIKNISNLSNIDLIKNDNEHIITKKRTLGLLSLQLIYIYLNNELNITNGINLDQTSELIIKITNQKYINYDELVKSKKRRLYDVFNVFKKIGLIKKINNKVGYKWEGYKGFLNKYITSKKNSIEIKDINKKPTFKICKSFIKTDEDYEFLENSKKKLLQKKSFIYHNNVKLIF